MIAIQKIGKSFAGALGYNIKKMNHPDKSKRAELLGSNFAFFDLKTINKEVELLRSLRPNLNRYVYHTSLNFPKEEQAQLSNEKLLSIALDYLKANGFTNNQYLIFKHNDTDHPHIHVLANRISFDGTVVSDSNNYRKSEAILRKLEYLYNLIPVEQSNFAATELYNTISGDQSNSRTRQQRYFISKGQGNFVSPDQYNGGAKQQNNNGTRQRNNYGTSEQNNYISAEQTIGVTRKRYNYITRRPPTRDEVGMMMRTGKASHKLLLQEIMIQLLKDKPDSISEFIRNAEKAGIHLLFNIASTGRVSGITYFFKDFKAKGQALGSRFKWAELVKQIPYSEKDTIAILEANKRTLAIYGNMTKSENGLVQEVDLTNEASGGKDENDRINSAKVTIANDLLEDNLTGNDLQINITDDVDDEAVYGKRRRRGYRKM